MTALHINTVVLQCDGCGSQLLNGQPFPSTTEARAAAYGQGWRFPNQISQRTGQPVQTASDACPNCLTNWAPQTNEPRPRYQRHDGTTT